MSSWVMAVEVTPSELVAVEVDPAAGTADDPSPRTATLEGGGDAVDRLADAFAALLEGTDRPARLVVATPADTERRRFEEIAEATALVGLPAPSWLPGPVAAVGDRLAGEVPVGGRAVVLDARDGTLTAWPVLRTAEGAEVGARGPVATGTRLDQLLLGVVRAQLTSLDPAADVGGPRPDARGDGDTRGAAARLRREVRRARTRLAETDAAEARVATGEHVVTVDRGVFDQLVEHALQETVGEIDRSTGAGAADPSAAVLVLGDRVTPLTRRLATLVGGTDEGLVVPRTATHGILGLAALLQPARPRTRAASGAQAIRSRRSVDSPSAPVGVGAAIGAAGAVAGGGPALDDAPGSPELRTPAHGLRRPDVAADDADREGPAEVTAVTGAPARPVAAPGSPEAAAPAEPAPEIPAARLPSTPVQAQRGSEGWPQAFGTGAGGVGAAPGLVASDEHGGPTNGTGVAGHAALAAARPHDARPTSDAPPGGAGSGPVRRPEPDDVPTPLVSAPGTGPVVRTGRGPDTAPQPVAAAAGPSAPPRGAVPVLVVLLLVAVLAAAGVLLLGPGGVAAAFGGLGAGSGLVLSW